MEMFSFEEMVYFKGVKLKVKIADYRIEMSICLSYVK